MKKIIKCVIILVLCLILVGCGEKNLSNDSAIINYNFNETAQFDNFTITALEIVQMEIFEDDVLKPKKGNVFVSVRFCIENISDEQVIISSLGMFKSYADGNEVEMSVTGSTEFTSRFYEETAIDCVMNSGDKKTGWYTVEIPEDWQELNIFVKSSVFSDDYVKFTYAK